MILRNITSGGFRDAGRSCRGLRHLLSPIETFKKRHRRDDLPRLSVILLDLPPHQQIEFLVGSPHLHVALQRYGIIGLHQRVEQFVNGNRRIRSVALRKIVALEQPRNGVLRTEPDHIEKRQSSEPFAIETDLRLFGVEDFENLRLVGFRVGLDFLER